MLRSAPITYQFFHGCKFHGHSSCPITKDEEFSPKNNTPLAELCTTTQKKWAYLVEVCYVQVAEMWECEWHKHTKTEPAVRQYVSETFKRLMPSYTKKKSYPQKLTLQPLSMIIPCLVQLNLISMSLLNLKKELIKCRRYLIKKTLKCLEMISATT